MNYVSQAPQPFRNLDDSGEAESAAIRLEARSRMPASLEMFDAFIKPLLTPSPARVLEVGAGTAPLARRVAKLLPDSRVYATDKSDGMVAYARRMAEEDGVSMDAAKWDVTSPASMPFTDGQFDLILSSVMMPYLTDGEALAAARTMVQHLSPGGHLVFIEQQGSSQTVFGFPQALMMPAREPSPAPLKQTLHLGLRGLLRSTGLELLPTQSFVWTETTYDFYVRDLLDRYLQFRLQEGVLTADEVADWRTALQELADAGDFYYGLVYHRIVGQKPA